MRYSKTQTLNHCVSQAYTQCLADLDSLIHQETDKSLTRKEKFHDSIVLNLDCIERIKASAESRGRYSTMDCSFGISNGCEVSMLLVEFRFNYKNLRNLNRQKLIDKVEGSSSLLGDSIPINPSTIFVFEKNLKEQAISRFNRMIPRISALYTVMDADDLEKAYFNF